jgi:hypothetical protein
MVSKKSPEEALHTIPHNVELSGKDDANGYDD